MAENLLQHQNKRHMRVLIFACSWSFMRIWECSLSNAVRFWFIRNCNAATESGNYLATKTAAAGNWRFNSIFFAAYRGRRVEANRCYLSGRNQLYNSCSVKLNCHEQSQTASDLTTDATVDALPATHTTKCGTWRLFYLITIPSDTTPTVALPAVRLGHCCLLQLTL